MTINIGILGLGHIGYYHVRALQAIPEYNLVAACDLNPDLKKLLPEKVKFYSSSETFFTDNIFDTVVIATPNASHYRFGITALKAGKNVIMEKPAATSLEEFLKLEDEFNDKKNLHIYYAFHAAKAYDVAWFKDYYADEQNRSKLGPLTAFYSTFYDPYFEGGHVKEEALELQNSWIDSGVNALSVISELMKIEELKLSDISKTRVRVHNPVVQALAQFVFPVNSFGRAGLGTINTNWTLGLNQKRTRLYYAHTGHVVELDHSNQKVTLQKAAGDLEVLQDFSAEGERLYNHYIGVFKTYLDCRNKGLFNGKTAKKIHQLLFQAEDEE